MSPAEVTRWALTDGSDPPPWGSTYIVREEITEIADDGTVIRTITEIERIERIELVDWKPTPEQLEEQERRYFAAWERVNGSRHPDDPREAS